MKTLGSRGSDTALNAAAKAATSHAGSVFELVILHTGGGGGGGTTVANGDDGAAAALRRHAHVPESLSRSICVRLHSASLAVLVVIIFQVDVCLLQIAVAESGNGG